jgi:hypothetical protein
VSPLPEGLGFSLAVPSSWWELDVDPATRASSLEELLDGQVRDVPELRPHRTTLSRLLREQAASAWEAGACYCASLVEPTDDGPVTASAVVLVVPAPSVPLPGADRVLALTCSSPVLPLADDLLDLFDAISGTLEINTA